MRAPFLATSVHSIAETGAVSKLEPLKRRGSLTIWFDPAMTLEAAPTGKRGRQPA